MRRILLLYTGGTIGSAGEPLRPMSGADFSSLLTSRPEFANGRCGPNAAWTLDCLAPPLDSADMQPTDWLRIAQTIWHIHSDFDGFVVLHGTDTLAWTAAALSFLLAGLSKPVVLTGSQRPLAVAGSDAPANLRLAIERARQGGCGVFVAFGGAVLLGSRVLKVDSVADEAFAAPAEPSLLPVVTETSDDIAARLTHVGKRLADTRVAVLHLYPGIVADIVEAAVRPPTAGLVLVAYGTGNAPTDTAFLDVLRRAHECGVVIVCVTQALRGGVRLHEYQTGAALAAAGAVSGHDMSPIAAYAKLVLLCAQGLRQHDIEALMQRNLAGELTEPSSPADATTAGVPDRSPPVD